MKHTSTDCKHLRSETSNVIYGGHPSPKSRRWCFGASNVLLVRGPEDSFQSHGCSSFRSLNHHRNTHTSHTSHRLHISPLVTGCTGAFVNAHTKTQLRPPLTDETLSSPPPSLHIRTPHLRAPRRTRSTRPRAAAARRPSAPRRAPRARGAVAAASTGPRSYRLRGQRGLNNGGQRGVTGKKGGKVVKEAKGLRPPQSSPYAPIDIKKFSAWGA